MDKISFIPSAMYPLNDNEILGCTFLITAVHLHSCLLHFYVFFFFAIIKNNSLIMVLALD